MEWKSKAYERIRNEKRKEEEKRKENNISKIEKM